MAYTIYGDLRSGALCVEAALAEAGASYEFATVSLDKNEQTSADYLRLNPSGKLPALKLPDGTVVTETAALLVILAERHPEAHLLPPAASTARARALRWIAFMAAEVYPMIEIVDYPARFAPEGDEAEALKLKARDRYRERIRIVEENIAGPWLLDSGFSAADIYAAMLSKWVAAGEWKDRNLPRLYALAEAVGKRPKIAPVWTRHFPNG